MIRMSYKISLVLLFAFCSISLFAQNAANDIPGIQMTGKRTSGGVMLRWVPETPGAWSLSRTHGYQLDRMAFTGEEDFHEVGYEPLTAAPVKPWPLERWDSLAMVDDQAAIAAEILYGELGNQPVGFFEKAAKFENIFSTAILAAEFSFATAVASGLGYYDRDVRNDMKYLYRIISLGSSDSYPIDTAYFLIDGNERETVPQVVIHEVLDKEGHVEIRWDREMHEQVFSAYYIEKSDDGRSFRRQNQAPYIDSPNDLSETSLTFISYIDSVQNYVRHYYRVTGITSFGELSEPSDVVSGMGRDRTPPTPPTGISAQQVSESEIRISWEYEDQPEDLVGFMIARSNDPEGAAVTLTDPALGPEARAFTDDTFDPLLNNWYFLATIDTANNASVAAPIYGGIVDSIPPLAPTNLSGKIDTSGVVTVTWDLGEERDLMGYMVFSTNQEDHTYANLSNRPLMDTVFTDTLDLSILTEEIFYKVVAVDAYYNHSGFSEVLRLEKPDLVPPIAPVFTKYKVSEEGIRLEWAQSSSMDVMKHQLSRREKGMENWVVIREFDSLGTYDQYTDTQLDKGKMYEYKIEAVDDAGLISPVSYVLSLKAIDFSQKPPVQNVTALWDSDQRMVLLSWSYPIEGDYTFRVYRAVDGGPFNLLGNQVGESPRLTDNRIRNGRTYEYAVKAVFDDGRSSAFGEVARVVAE